MSEEATYGDASHIHNAVQVTRAIRASADAAWAALTDPEMVRQWFGALSAPLCQGELINLDFDDGDFFVLEVIQVDPPRTLQYIWRLLGIGPKETITWQITPQVEGCLVTVSDVAFQRTADATHALRSYWLDQTARLEHFLCTRTPIRAPWRRDIYASTELPGTAQAVWAHMIDPAAQARWLPLGTLPEAGRAGHVKDGAAPAEFEVADLRLDSQNHYLSFRLAHPSWLASTTCSLELSPRNQGTLLAVRHTGWEAISFDHTYQKQQRRRFAGLWHKALLYFSLGYIRKWTIPTLSPTELQAQLGQPDLFVLDSNRVTLWEQGHIPGAIFVGQEDIPLDLLPAQKHAALVFYCRDSM